jgi:peptidoglycan/xylan/chitin deacetylase (PgdA/CDA1 family)
MPGGRGLTKFSEKLRGQRYRAARWRLLAERRALARLHRPATHHGGRIFSYHSTGTPEWGVNDVHPANFFAQLELAKSLGYRFVPAASIAAGTANDNDLAITFDDGLASILAVTPYLLRQAIPFTVFVVTDWASQPGERFLTWVQLKELADTGATIGSHSVTHANFRGLSLTQREHELVASREQIGARLGGAPELFAIPFGRARDWPAEDTQLAHRAGYSAVFAQSEARRPGGTIGRSFVSKYDGAREFRAILAGRFDAWEEWF